MHMQHRLASSLKFFLRHDLKASITVFFVALPLCLGVALASNAPVASGLIAGVVGGIAISLISRSQLSVSGPAAGLTAICAGAIAQPAGLEGFYISVAIAGVLQLMLGVLRLGAFTQFIPSSVIKGMLAAIGVLLISKQLPAVIGYDRPDFWSNGFFNIITFDHVYSNIQSLYLHASAGPVVIALSSMAVLVLWKKYAPAQLRVIPASFLAVLTGIILAQVFERYFSGLQLSPGQYVSIPSDIFSGFSLPDFTIVSEHPYIFKNAAVICFVASLETLLSLTAIDKLDPLNRVSPQNRELVAQGAGNVISGLLGGLPITAVIVRSAANAEAGARTRWSAFFHGVWLLLAVLLAVPLLNQIPYAVLAVVLIRTGYNLAKPQMIKAIYKQGREQFVPFIITVLAILFTDLLLGVLIGFVYSVYYLIKHTYRAGFSVKEEHSGHSKRYRIKLALNVSFLNKKRFIDLLDSIPPYAEVEIDGTDSVYIDRDVLEIFQEFKSKAHSRHIQLELKQIPQVDIIVLH
jgi:MFS superfamily sulfate permease-like transporter